MKARSNGDNGHAMNNRLTVPSHFDSHARFTASKEIPCYIPRVIELTEIIEGLAYVPVEATQETRMPS